MSETSIGQVENHGPLINASSLQGENILIGGNIQNNYTDPFKARLVNVDFSLYDDEYVAPNFTNDLLQVVLEKRIVFIAGDATFGKTGLAKHLSRKITAQADNGSLGIHEFLKGNEDQDTEGSGREQRVSIFTILTREKCERNVVLLPELHPEKIDYNFDKLLHYAHENDCYFIISVNYSIEIWLKAGKLIRDYWFELPEGRYYSEEQMNAYFLQKLKRSTPVFMENLEIEPDASFLLSPSITVGSALRAFTSIDQVSVFLNYYSCYTEQPNDRKLAELIETLCQSYEHMVQSWFYQLCHRDKVIALSAALFDGLLIDQFFEALNNITSTSFWQISELSLKAIDYFDLSFLDTFFHIQSREGSLYLNCKTPTTKSTLLELGKKEYRRHFKVALRELHQLATASYQRKAINWELFGSASKRVLIRRAFTESIRDIGVLEFGVVEHHLLELAASKNNYLQNICAKSMAQWRLSGHEELFFNTLKNWQYDHTIETRIKEFFERTTVTSEAQDIQAIDQIQITAVLALGYASYYDQPNKLHEDIIETMIHLAKTDSSAVLGSINKALPKFIHHHCLQLQEKLFNELMPIYDLRDAITEGLRLAYGDYPEEVSLALVNWLAICIEEYSKGNRRKKFTMRDTALTIILNILLGVDLTENKHFPLEKLYTGYLIPLVQQEGRNTVLEIVIRLLAKVQTGNVEMATRFAEDTIHAMTKQERLFLVVCWGECYISQRKQSATTIYQRNGENYPLWIGSDNRPLTPVETILFQWMESDTILRRFAILVFLELERTYDQYEREARRNYFMLQQQEEVIAYRRSQAATTTATPFLSAPQELRLHLLMRLHIFFYFLFSSNTNKYLLKDTLLLFLNVHRYTTTHLMQVTDRWRSGGNPGSTAGKLSKWIFRFIR